MTRPAPEAQQPAARALPGARQTLLLKLELELKSEKDNAEVRNEDGDKRTMEGLMIFRDDAKLPWEDPLSATGGHSVTALQPEIGSGQIDEYWNSIVVAWPRSPSSRRR